MQRHELQGSKDCLTNLFRLWEEGFLGGKRMVDGIKNGGIILDGGKPDFFAIGIFLTSKRNLPLVIAYMATIIWVISIYHPRIIKPCM